MNSELESGHEFSDEETQELLHNTDLSRQMTNTELDQQLLGVVTAKFAQDNKQWETTHIGDQVEGILSLAYQLVGDDSHKIDMDYECCCSLKDTKQPYKTAILKYIQKEKHS